MKEYLVRNLTYGNYQTITTFDDYDIGDILDVYGNKYQVVEIM